MAARGPADSASDVTVRIFSCVQQSTGMISICATFFPHCLSLQVSSGHSSSPKLELEGALESQTSNLVRSARRPLGPKWTTGGPSRRIP